MAVVEMIHTLMDYNDALHRRVWESILTLSNEQFTAEIPYSHGSIRNQMVHLAAVDGRWLRGLKGLSDARSFNPAAVDYATARSVYGLWDEIARALKAYVFKLTEAELESTPPGMPGPVWQVLIHVANHGTDHRAQVLRALHDFGAPTFDQDLILHIWRH